jgi:lipopolysaccharide transport system permease protein
MSFIHNIAAPIISIWQNRKLLLHTTIIELKTTYAGSVLGLAWMAIGPALLLGIYAVVYSFIFKVKPEMLSPSEYIIYVFCGLVPFLAFSASLTQGAMSLASNRTIMLSTVFPPELLPLRSVIIGSISLPIGLLIIFGADIFYGEVSWTSLLVFPVIIMQIMFLSGISWILSLMTLVLKDIQQILQYVSIVLLVLTPIAYTPDMIPQKLKMVSYLNPLYYYAASFQYLITYNQIPPIEIIIGLFVLTFTSFFAGYTIFQKIKAGFYDYV